MPYQVTTNNYGYPEQFSKGAFGEDVPKVQILYNHDNTSTPIGRVTAYEDSDAGLVISAKIAETEKGNEVYQLIKEGVLDSFSVSVYPEESFDDEGITVWTKAELLEISVVNRPAFKDAKIQEVYNEQDSDSTSEQQKQKGDSEESIMTEQSYEDAELRSGLEDLERRFSVLEEEGTAQTNVVGSDIKSFGEYVKRIAAGDAEATELMYAYTGGTSADSVVTNGWDKSLVRIVEQNRKVMNVFSKGSMPSEGMNIEYLKLKADSTSVTEQATEGADLAYGEVSVETATAAIKTYGGYTRMTRQEIERANVNIVDTAFSAMAAKYASTTESAVRTALSGASAHGVEDATVATFDGWIDFLVDASVHLDGKGLAPEFVIVSQDVFKAAAKLKSGDQYLLDRNNGSVNVTGVSGSVLNVPMVVIPGTAVTIVGHSSAIKTFESAGAPLRLQDENIVNLSKDFSVYGYLSVAVQDAEALVKPVDLVA